MLAKDALDFAIGAFDRGPPWQTRRLLGAMKFRCVGHPDVIGRSGIMTLHQYVALSHLLVSHRGSFEGRVDIALAKLGLARNVAYTSPHFSSLPRVLQQVKAVAAVPEGLTPIWERDFGLASATIPLDLPLIEIALVHHGARDNDPLVQWICSIVDDLIKGVLAPNE
jgi:DNA-binding transcriptional LysR family regulator